MGRGVTWAYLYFLLLVKSLRVHTYARIPANRAISESFIHCFGARGAEPRQRDLEPGFRTASGCRYRSFRSNASNKGGAKGAKKTVISGTAAERQALIDRSLELGISQDDIDDYLKQYKVVKSKRPAAAATASKPEVVPASPVTADKETAKPAGSPAEQPKKRKLPKRLLEKSEYLPERGVEYPLYDAIDRIKLISGVRFVEGIDVALHVPLSRKKIRATAAQYARLITIPHQSLKSKRCRIGVFAKPAVCDQVRALNATKVLFVGGADLIEQFKAQDQYPDVDFVLSDLETFHKLSTIGRQLGRRGLMPSLTVGTCIQHTADLLETVEKVEHRNTFILRADRVGDIKCNFADVTMPREEIRENLLEIVKYLRQNKPEFAGAQLLSAAYVSSSMGPSFRIFLKDLGCRGRVKRRR